MPDHSRSLLRPSLVEMTDDAHCPYRLLVQTAAQFAGANTGGPECLVSLALALAAGLPSGCTSIFTGNRLPASLRTDYPTFGTPLLAERGVEGREEQLLRAGDVLVLPEVDACPEHLVARGVHVWIYQLGTSPACRRLRQGCRFLVHNFWLSTQYGVNVSRDLVVRPPLNPTHLAERGWHMLPSAQRADTVVINGHDLPSSALAAIEAACERVRLHRRDERRANIHAPHHLQERHDHRHHQNVTCLVPRGYSKPALRRLMGTSKIVVAWCMRGSERLPLEAVTYRNVLLSNDCAVGSDDRDFPLPPQHRLATAEAIGDAIEALLTSPADYEEALRRQLRLRLLYLGLGAASMAEEATMFLRGAREPLPPSELGECRPRA